MPYIFLLTPPLLLPNPRKKDCRMPSENVLKHIAAHFFGRKGDGFKTFHYLCDNSHALKCRSHWKDMEKKGVIDIIFDVQTSQFDSGMKIIAIAPASFDISLPVIGIIYLIGVGCCCFIHSEGKCEDLNIG